MLKDESLTVNINTAGCRQAIISLAQYAVKILSAILIGVTVVLVIILKKIYILSFKFTKKKYSTKFR